MQGNKLNIQITRDMSIFIACFTHLYFPNIPLVRVVISQFEYHASEQDMAQTESTYAMLAIIH